jgi:hypothetical protein
MSRGHGWWGTAPLAVGAIGLLLLVFGAPCYEGSEEINENAKKLAEQFAAAFTHVDPSQWPLLLQEEEEALKRQGKSVDLRSLAKTTEEEVDPDIPAKARQRLYEARSDHRDPRALIGGRIAFYAGLVLVFAAGVLLYRRAPESNHEAW